MAHAQSEKQRVQIGRLEHVNITVSDVERTSRMLETLFGWRERWRGPAAMGGYTIHVGTESEYLAVYARSHDPAPIKPYSKGCPLNHVGIVVDDLDALEARVAALGYKPFGHGDYEPGRRFYFFDHDGIEFEIVSYARVSAPRVDQDFEIALATADR